MTDCFANARNDKADWLAALELAALELAAMELAAMELAAMELAALDFVHPSHLCLHKTVGFINAVKDMLAMTLLRHCERSEAICLRSQ